MSKLSSTIIRHSVTLLVVVVGVAGGMYIGSVIGHDDSGPAPRTTQAVETDPHYLPRLEAGDLLPPIDLQDTPPAPTLQDLVRGSRTVVMFVSGGCPNCSQLLDHWRDHVVGTTSSPIEVVLAESNPAHPLSDDQLALLPQATRVSCNREQTIRLFNIIVSPTIIAVDNQGFVQAVQVGFDGHFSQEMIEYLRN